MCKLELFCIVLAGLCITQAEHTLRITNLEVPRGPLQYEDAPLNCQYEIGENDKLYDVKWYKDNNQFFRCAGDGSIQEFNAKGIRLHHSGRTTLGSCPVTLLRVTDDAAGIYKCEVSLDFPTFKTVTESAMMRVIHYPKQNIYTTAETVEVDTVTPSSIQYSTATESGSSQHIHLSLTSLIFITFFLCYLYV